MNRLSRLTLALFVLTVALMLPGCAFYHAERTEPDGSRLVFDVKSFRKFPGGIAIDAEEGKFHLRAGEVTALSPQDLAILVDAIDRLKRP